MLRHPQKIVLVDNFDSFTYNLLHYLTYSDAEVKVFRNHETPREALEEADKIIISPGPGLPRDAGQSLELIRTYGSRKPMLGVCLGHQAIAIAFGGTLRNMKQVMHGVARNTIVIREDYLFHDIPASFHSGRYHSWVVDEENLPSSLEVLATDQNGDIMALRHKELDIRGVQFHPESILSNHGLKMISNWIMQAY